MTFVYMFHYLIIILLVNYRPIRLGEMLVYIACIYHSVYILQVTLLNNKLLRT